MEDEDLVVLPETAPATEPVEEVPPDMPDLLLEVTLPPNAKQGMSLKTTCDG